MKYFVSIFCCMFILLGSQTLWAQKGEDMVRNYLHGQIEKGLLLSADLEFRISSEHTSSISQVHHIYFSQSLFELEIIGTNSSVHINSSNEIISHSNGFLKDLSNKRIGNQNPQLSAKQAVFLAADQLGYKLIEDLIVLNKKEGKSHEYLLSGGGISIGPIPIKLKYLVSENDELELIWEFAIEEISQEHWWNIRASARTGKIIEKDDFVVNCDLEYHHTEEDSKLDNNLVETKVSSTNYLSGANGAGCSDCYEVIPYPLESPLYGDRVVEILSTNFDASPYGWHDTNGAPGPEYTVTRGNNVNAYDGGDNFGYQPDGGSSLNFTGFDFNPIYTENNQYEDASITNLFYWINILHDLTFEYGFTEAAGNFQSLNYSGEGIGDDSLKGEAQSDRRNCNASLKIPRDGISPTMRVDLCNDKDGVFDNAVVIHEFGHGVTTRLVGGAASASCLFNDEQMGEGWSDWYALIMTMKPDDLEELPRGIATYYIGFGPLGGGVRKYPYSTDLEITPLTYDSIKIYDYTHGVGTVWASMLWELTWALINQYGFDPDLNSFTGNINQDAGNVIAMAIITEALKITPCSPGFVDARDAIIVAAHEIYGNEIDCILWPAFAKRGLGIQAYQGNPRDLYDGLESYEVPPDTAVFQILRDSLCQGTDILANEFGGLPYGGFYEGPGVTDNGDGRSYIFDPSILEPGIYSISYTVIGSDCQEASTAVDNVEIVADNEAPVITCREDFSVTISDGEEGYLLPYYPVMSSDNCTGVTNRQEPRVNSILDLGINIITVYAVDRSGNESSCSYSINVVANNLTVNNDDDLISLFPNPTKGVVEMNSNNDLGRLTVTIMDINSRFMGEFLYRKFGYNNTFTLRGFAPGLYFVKIETENINQIYKIVKK